MSGVYGREKKMIPAGPFVVILRRYVDEYQALIGESAGKLETRAYDFFGQCVGKGGWNINDALTFVGAPQVLAEEAGVAESTVSKLLRGKRKWVSFDIADKLLTAMGRTDCWFVELAPYYQEVEI